ncbi:ribonuclease H-like domain-containing protein [Tanacetum coccineum]
MGNKIAMEEDGRWGYLYCIFYGRRIGWVGFGAREGVRRGDGAGWGMGGRGREDSVDACSVCDASGKVGVVLSMREWVRGLPWCKSPIMSLDADSVVMLDDCCCGVHNYSEKAVNRYYDTRGTWRRGRRETLSCSLRTCVQISWCGISGAGAFLLVVRGAESEAYQECIGNIDSADERSDHLTRRERGGTTGERKYDISVSRERGLPKNAETPQVMMIRGGKIQKANKKSHNTKGQNKVKGKGKDKKHGSDTAYLLLYVDDIVLTASSQPLLQRIIASLHQEFSMTDLGSLNYFLGISVTRDSSGMFLSQKKYVVKILERAHMANCNPCRTPVDTESKLGNDGDPVSDPTLIPGSLRVFFFQVLLNYGFALFSSSTTDLVAYSDADWAGCPKTRRSTSGYYRQVSWRLPTAVADTSWLEVTREFTHSTPLSSATLVYCDNVSAVYLSSNPVQHQRTKHIEIDIHFVRDLVAAGQVRVLHVPSRYQFTDIFAFNVV